MFVEIVGKPLERKLVKNVVGFNSERATIMEMTVRKDFLIKLGDLVEAKEEISYYFNFNCETGDWAIKLVDVTQVKIFHKLFDQLTP